MLFFFCFAGTFDHTRKTQQRCEIVPPYAYRLSVDDWQSFISKINHFNTVDRYLYLKMRVAKCRVPLRPVIGRRGERARVATLIS